MLLLLQIYRIIGIFCQQAVQCILVNVRVEFAVNVEILGVTKLHDAVLERCGTLFVRVRIVSAAVCAGAAGCACSAFAPHPVKAASNIAEISPA